ncbi:MAG TPA: PorP/SprF family type IX secretion system membrane protein [Cyclobacteriaceae bacterium]
MFFRSLIFLLLCIAFEPIMAQDISNFTQFFFNPYSINPSYAGIDGRPSATLSYRRQWATIEGGPTVANFSFHMPTTKHLSFGCNVLQDSRGILSNTGLLLTLGYGVQLTQSSYLRFGVSAGVAFNRIDISKLAGMNDNALSKIASSDSYLLGNAGLSFHAKSFHAGVSLPLLLKPAYVSQDAFSVTQVNPLQSLIIHASNRFYFQANKYVFEPYLLYRINQGLPSQFELATVLHLNHVVYVGASYKQDFGISALGGIKINNVFVIGASYGLKTTGANELNSPTYEVHLGYLFGKHKKENYMYSFVDTHIEKVKKGQGKSASEQLAEKHHQEELQRKKNEHQALLDKQAKEKELQKQKDEKQLAQDKAPAVDVATKTNVKPETITNNKTTPQTNAKPPVVTDNNKTTVKTDTKTTAKTDVKDDKQVAIAKKEPEKINAVEKPKLPETKPDTTVIKHKPRFNHEDIGFAFLNATNSEHTPEDEQERISRLTLHADNPTEQHNETNHPNAERHEIVKKGTHEKELQVSDYVIGGVFKAEEHAKHFADGLKKLGFKAGYGHLTEKAVWYVYVFKTDDINKARDERNSLRKTKILRDAWLLTVQD